MTIERDTTDFEKAVFTYLDIMSRENTTKVNALSLRIKWKGLSENDSEKLILWWNMNSDKKSYDTIVSLIS